MTPPAPPAAAAAQGTNTNDRTMSRKEGVYYVYAGEGQKKKRRICYEVSQEKWTSGDLAKKMERGCDR
eukprot:scaffold8319_cov211-Ochromonas_danica.AAC.2